jgi:hypothetical protein
MVGTKRLCIVVTKKRYTLGRMHSSLTLYISDLSKELYCSILRAKLRIFVILSPQSIARKILDIAIGSKACE